jgi:beta-barrel assembly-enhancing protease
MIPTGSRPAGRRFGGGRLIIAAIVAIVSIITYYSQRSSNPVTGEVQHVDLSPEQEVALGLQAAPEMAQQHGGLHPDAEAQAVVDRVGRRIVEHSAARESPYEYEFHVLADENMINAFALPGGQVFITAGLLKRMQTEGQLAGVLGHEIGHVVARHGAEHLAKARLTQGLTGAAVLATYDPDNPASRNSAAVAALIGNLVNMRFGRNDELESDKLGVRFTAEAGYDPRAMIEVMRVLAESASGPRPPEFFSTHPNPDRRVERIQAAIAETFPNGVPEELEG